MFTVSWLEVKKVTPNNVDTPSHEDFQSKHKEVILPKVCNIESLPVLLDCYGALQTPNSRLWLSLLPEFPACWPRPQGSDLPVSTNTSSVFKTKSLSLSLSFSLCHLHLSLLLLLFIWRTLPISSASLFKIIIACSLTFQHLPLSVWGYLLCFS